MTSAVKHALKLLVCTLDDGLVKEGRVVPVPSIKAYWGSGDIAPLIPNLSPIWRWVVKFRPR